jgi:hypothetical protein
VYTTIVDVHPVRVRSFVGFHLFEAGGLRVFADLYAILQN